MCMDNTAQKSLPLSGQTFLFSTVECGKHMETLHEARLTALHAICVQIFRHIVQKSLAIHEVCLRNFYAICRKI